MDNIAAGIQLGLRFGGFEFAPLETLLLVVSLATALVSGAELVHLLSRDRLQQRVAALRGAMVTRTETTRRGRLRWFGQLGAVIASSPLVGETERQRLTTKLAAAGFGGRGRLATFIAMRFIAAIVLLLGVWITLNSVEVDPVAITYFATAFATVIGWRLPDVVLTRLANRRQLLLELGFPDALDLLVICAEAGLGMEQAFAYVAHDMRFAMPDVAEEFATTEAEMRVVADRRVALEHLAERTGIESLKSLMAILNQSVRFGTPLTEALRQLTAEARMVRMARLEERAGRLSVTLLLPVMLFILPCMFLVLCGPIALRAIDLFSSVMSMP